MDAKVRRQDGQNGVIYATGTENSGFSFFVHNDHLLFDYNVFGEHLVVESPLVLVQSLLAKLVVVLLSQQVLPQQVLPQQVLV